MFEEQIAAIEEDSSVEGGFAIRAAGWQRDAGQDCSGQIECGGSKLVNRRPAAGEEAGLLKEVGGRIAADDEFGEDRQSSARIGGAPAESDDFLQISGEIPDRGIDLRQRDLHKISVNGTELELRCPLGQRNTSEMRNAGRNDFRPIGQKPEKLSCWIARLYAPIPKWGDFFRRKSLPRIKSVTI